MAKYVYVVLELECDVEGCGMTELIAYPTRQLCFELARKNGWIIGKNVRCSDHGKKEDRT